MDQIEIGMRVRVTQLNRTDGMIIRRQYLEARCAGAVGAIHSVVPGHGGDVWFITHDDGTIAAYSILEFEKE